MKVQKPLTPKEMERLCLLLDEECEYTLPRELMLEFLGKGEVRFYKNKEFIHREDTSDPDIYIVIDGIIRRWYWNGDIEVTRSFSISGTMIISYHSYYGNLPPAYFNQACCDTLILRITRKDFDDMIRKYADFARWCLRMAQCQHFFYEKKDRIINGSVKERYMALEKNRPEIIRKVSLKIIASYLGVTPQYLSSIRNEKYKIPKN